MPLLYHNLASCHNAQMQAIESRIGVLTHTCWFLAWFKESTPGVETRGNHNS